MRAFYFWHRQCKQRHKTFMAFHRWHRAVRWQRLREWVLLRVQESMARLQGIEAKLDTAQCAPR